MFMKTCPLLQKVCSAVVGRVQKSTHDRWFQSSSLAYQDHYPFGAWDIEAESTLVLGGGGRRREREVGVSVSKNSGLGYVQVIVQARSILNHLNDPQ